MGAHDLEKELRDHSESISLLTHEMRSSLGAIMGFIETLYDARLTVKERFQCIRRVTDTIVQTSRTLEDLEHLNSIENGAFSLRSIRFRLEEELSKIAQFLQSLTRRSELRLEIINHGPFPEYILSDPLRIRELLTCLVDLAVQKTERGTVRITLGMTEEAHPKIEFIVDSTGYNLPRQALTETAPWEDAPRSEFEVSQIHGKTLIGISLVKSLTRVLGGDLTLEKSVMGRGEMMRIRIDPGPLQGTAMKERLELSTSEEPLTSVTPFQVPDLSGKRFLIIEDDDDIAGLMSAFLSKSKAVVEIARNGLEGLDKAMATPFHLILMDIQIPEINGVELSRILREKGLTTPIIAVTANASVNARTKSLSAGCNLFLTKPFSMDALLKLVKQVVS